MNLFSVPFPNPKSDTIKKKKLTGTLCFLPYLSFAGVAAQIGAFVLNQSLASFSHLVFTVTFKVGGNNQHKHLLLQSMLLTERLRPRVASHGNLNISMRFLWIENIRIAVPCLL